MEAHHQKSWFGRNWPWLLPVGGCLIIIFLFVFGIGAAIFGGVKLLKNSEPFEYALETATNNEELIAIIGEPIETDGIMQGSLNCNNGRSSADITIPLKGPEGEASVTIVGEKLDEDWEYEEFYITIKATNEKINLLDKVLEGI